MSIIEFITKVFENQAANRRFVKVVEDAVILYLLFAAVWSLCSVVGKLFSVWGVA